MMPVYFIIAGLSLGILSSFHCVGMCGPLVMALPVQHLSVSKRKFAILLYHAGRITTYSVLGLVFATLGRGIYIAGLQQYLSISLGIIMLVISGVCFLPKGSLRSGFAAGFYIPVQRLMSYALRSNKISGFLLLGIFNGLLPCGMVYIAIAGALTSQEVIQGVAFMCAYGLGTLPLLLLVSVFSCRLSIPIRNNIRKLFPVIAITMAVLLIMRGMNLGIPYISPELPQAFGKAIICH